MLHTKLIKSYAVEAELKRSQPAVQASTTSPQEFLASVLSSTESRFQSPGGHDYRFEAPGTSGSALVDQSTVIHLAFLSGEDGDRKGETRRRWTRLNPGLRDTSAQTLDLLNGRRGTHIRSWKP